MAVLKIAFLSSAVLELFSPRSAWRWSPSMSAFRCLARSASAHGQPASI
jgi:ABC-type transport system involved in cytochrome bd biosynthesis fused ATPase/permease subunit